MRKRRDKGSGAAGIGRPLLGSATGHIVLLSFLLLAGYAAGPNSPGVVEVALVEGPALSVPAAEMGLTASVADASRRPEVRPESEMAPPPGATASTSPPPTAAALPLDIPPAAPVALIAGTGGGRGGERADPASSAAPAGALEMSPREAEHSGGAPAVEGVQPAARPYAGPAGVVREGAHPRGRGGNT
jgi:hypothetical protein